MGENLYEDALDAITELFSDVSASQRETKENLNSLIGEIETMIDGLDDEE